MHSNPNLRRHESHKFEKDENIECDLTWVERILDLGNVNNLKLCYSKTSYSMYDLVFEGLSEAAEAFVAGATPEEAVPNGQLQQAVITQLEQPAARSRRVRAPRIKRYLDWFGVEEWHHDFALGETDRLASAGWVKDRECFYKRTADRTACRREHCRFFHLT